MLAFVYILYYICNMKKNVIYKITSPSDKVYIGQSLDFTKRMKQYKRMECKGQIGIYNSLKKYGFDNHKFEVIEECSIDLLNERERYWQDYYNVLKNGLNCFLTSTNNKKSVWSLASREKASKSASKRVSSESTKKKISEFHKKRWSNIKKEDRKATESTRLKMSIASKSNKNGFKNLKLGSNLGLPVLQLDKHFNIIEEFVSQAEAGLKIGCDPSGIHRVANGHRQYCKGFIWRYKYIEHIGNKKTYTKNLTSDKLTLNTEYLTQIKINNKS